MLFVKAARSEERYRTCTSWSGVSIQTETRPSHQHTYLLLLGSKRRSCHMNL